MDPVVHRSSLCPFLTPTEQKRLKVTTTRRNPTSPGGSDIKECACNVGGPDSIPGSERSPGEGNGSPLQYSCLENSMDRGVWWATSMGLQRVGQDKRVNTLTFSLFYDFVP